MPNFSMNSREITPWELFEGGLYRIPDYQRGYAWERATLSLMPGTLHVRRRRRSDGSVGTARNWPALLDRVVEREPLPESDHLGRGVLGEVVTPALHEDSPAG